MTDEIQNTDQVLEPGSGAAEDAELDAALNDDDGTGSDSEPEPEVITKAEFERRLEQSRKDMAWAYEQKLKMATEGLATRPEAAQKPQRTRHVDVLKEAGYEDPAVLGLAEELDYVKEIIGQQQHGENATAAETFVAKVNQFCAENKILDDPTLKANFLANMDATFDELTLKDALELAGRAMEGGAKFPKALVRNIERKLNLAYRDAALETSRSKTGKNSAERKKQLIDSAAPPVAQNAGKPGQKVYGSYEAARAALRSG